jgi:hypothetical protein
MHIHQHGEQKTPFYSRLLLLIDSSLEWASKNAWLEEKKDGREFYELRTRVQKGERKEGARKKIRVNRGTVKKGADSNRGPASVLASPNVNGIRCRGYILYIFIWQKAFSGTLTAEVLCP